MHPVHALRKKWTEIDPLGVAAPSLSMLAFPFVLAKALQVPWLQVTHYAPLGTTITAAVALLTYWRNQALENDRVLAKKASQALEHAYETFTAASTSKRYLWLATSRLLLRFKTIKDQLRTIPYQDACLSDEDYWKHKFYEAISSLEKPLASLLSIPSPPDVDNQIERRSALVILEFCNMTSDPIDEVDESRLYQRVKGKWGLKVDRLLEESLTLQGLDLISAYFAYEHRRASYGHCIDGVEAASQQPNTEGGEQGQ
ncbi:hypothetical protein [Cyanobium sp. LEGE 06143]|uniref:hypothetical protein n=1 Tax=Cyanobium sp. LEGE 06143 TaxID=945727 RepID=UPI00187E868E|nr:hypothetical protein [Cyanobium sp. LEGE 06143]